MKKSKIEWTESTWGVLSGCSKVSEACQNCYAETMARRLSGMPGTKEKYKNVFELTLHPECLDDPYRWTKPRMVFVASMGDLFHEDVPFEFIDRVMLVISQTPKHTYQLLTKRAARMKLYFLTRGGVPKNCWLGVTCENANHYDRISRLREIECDNVKFLSCEPLLGDMSDIDLTGIDWVITGGESGVRARKTKIEWFRNLRDVCLRTNTPFFFKQWGAWGEDGIKRSKYENGSVLDGQTWKQYPYKENGSNP